MFGRIKLSGCNLNCIYCPEDNRGGKVENNFDQIITLIDALHNNGINEIKWSGGEATVYPRFLELVEYGKQKGMYQSLSTNGTCKPNFLKKMKDAGLFRINISLDTLSRDKYKYLCGRDFLYKVLDNINLSSTVFDEVTKINVVVSDYNIDEIQEIHNKFKTNNKVIVRFIQLTYKGKDSFTDNHRKKIFEIENQFSEYKKIDKLDTKTFRNPVAEYYKSGDGNIFSIIPQDNSCYPSKCKKIWYEDGYVFNCKIGGKRIFLDSEKTNSIIKHLIDSNSTKIKRIHKMENVT